MSTEHNVNRVNSSFNVEAEKAKLEPKPELAVDLLQYGVPNYDRKVKGFTPVDPTVETEESNKLLEQDPEALKSAWEELTKVDPSLEDILSRFRAQAGGDDLKVFRGQVIRALKHLGVDTKKFFGE